MKKFISLLAIALALIAIPVMAADQTQTLKFGWQQPQSDLQNLSTWSLYWSDSAGGGFQMATAIPYSGGSGPDFNAEKPLTVSGMPGQQIVKHFMLTATSKNGKESGGSNVVSHTFAIPYSDVAAPQSLTIQVVVQTQAKP
jgi:hypothetical protein